MTFWLNADGKIVLNDDGKFALCDACPCDTVFDCSGISIPSILYITFGDYAGVNDFAYLGTVRLDYNSSTLRWESSALVSPCSEETVYIGAVCSSGIFEMFFYFVPAGSSNNVSVSISSADPFYATNSAAVFDIPGCMESKQASVTFTEVSP